MHSILAHIYYLSLLPFWHGPAAAFAVGLILRRHGCWAALAVLAGWLAAQYPTLSILPAHPIYRLAGLAALLLAHSWLARGSLPALAAVASWWIAGAPFDLSGIAACLPIFLGVWTALALVRRLAMADRGWAGVGASFSLAACLFLAGAAPHWARAALVPACAGLALMGVAEAVLPLAFATMLVGCAAAVASDRGRFVPVDLAALAPLLVWFLATRTSGKQTPQSPNPLR